MNKIINGNCVEIMKSFENNSIDLTITSPPYDNLRNYNGYNFDFKKIAKELFRITKDGGIVVWIVGDKKEKGSRTLTQFTQGLFFKKIGFNIHDIMIWRKPNPMPYILKNCYTPSFEYMIVLSKGKPKTTNIIKEPCKYAGKILKTYTKNPESIRRPNKTAPTKQTKIKSNVWDYIIAGTNHGHPAIFPEKLAEDHILSWSNEGDTILDPMCGSGTTCKMAKLNNRNYIRIDCSAEYCEIAKERCSQTKAKSQSKFDDTVKRT